MNRISFHGYRLGGGKEEFYRIEPPDSAQSGNYYFLSNDVFVDSFGFRKSEPHIFWGIANPHFFHILTVALGKRSFRRIIAIDSNIDQLHHFLRLYNLIVNSKSRIDYLQNLFKVVFNNIALKILNEFPSGSASRVRGGAVADKFAVTERLLWQNCSFDGAAFQQTYGLNVTKSELGLKINSNTIGDINEYYATILCCGRRSYPVWPFTAGFGTGFLRDEDSFVLLQQALVSVPVYALLGDISELFRSIVYSNRYEPQVFWASNLFCSYFTDKHPALLTMSRELNLLGTQKEPAFPELDVVVFHDRREKYLGPSLHDRFWRNRRLSIHTQTFRKLVLYLEGSNNVEVVNVPEWIVKDNGCSKLPNTDYMELNSFLRLETNKQFDSLILHILVGHGLPKNEFADVLRKSLTMTDNLIVLEHNKESVDFRRDGIGMSIDEIQSVLGPETVLDFGPGKHSADRNLIMVYRK